MNPETKQCVNCKQNFVIEPEDFAFYEKISAGWRMPAPTWCPDCRSRRRMQWTNYRHWYPRELDGKRVLSYFHPEAPVNVMSVKEWWSDSWSGLEYGREYDFSRPFFLQFIELYREVPRPHMINDLESTRCDYCNDVGTSKNCYLSTTIIESEEINYSTTVVASRELWDSFWVFKSELCYECIDCYSSRGVMWGQNVDSCLDSMLLFDCKNVSNCIACVGMRNAQYSIFNEPVGKQAYEEFLSTLIAGGYDAWLKLKERFEAFKLTRPHRYAQIHHSVNCTGDQIRGGKNCKQCFDVSQELEDLKFVTYAGLGIKDSYDCYNAGSIANTLYEGNLVGSDSSRLFFCNNVMKGCMNIYYSDNCVGSSNLFGCVGLKKNSYCILNRQYSKQEYEELVEKIKQHMNDMPYTDAKGRVYKYGEFFPPELSPFAYNETIANEHFPLSKDEAQEQGYKWRDQEKRSYQITLRANDLPQDIRELSDNITDEIIECEDASQSVCGCTTAFRILEKDLEFYRRFNIPLPRLCPNCRYKKRFLRRNPLKLWHRKCMNQGCTNEFETSYSPDRPEIVYCEKCYQQEVV